jgi:Methyltransferase domain
MSWRLKSAQFKLLSLLPAGTSLYTWMQEHVTHSTRATRGRVEQKIQVGLDLWHWLQQQHCTDKVTGGNVLDLGAGWHPTIPLLWHAFGNNQQTLVDVSPNMDAGKAVETIQFFREIVSDPRWPDRASGQRLPEVPVAQGPLAAPLLAPIGIEYQAPYGDLLSRRPAQYDLVVCTQVLQHIPQSVQRTIFRDLHTCLKPGGLFHATIHFVGQFTSPYLQRGQFEHLSYSPEGWERWINSSLMAFNRLKGPDYRETLEQAGFRLREFRLTMPDANDLAELKRTRVHHAFQRYAETDLAARGVFFVAEKP